ncbi:MAG: M1 family aminopeptidase [Polyangiaceae bacterium]
MRLTGIAALALVLCACSGEPLPPPHGTPSGSASASATTTSAAAEPAPTPPAFRIPDGIAPTRIAATLTLVPAEDTFRGVAEIDLTVAHPSKVIWLHATDMTVSEAHVEIAGEKNRPARVITGSPNFLGFAFDEALPSGPSRLSVTYTGRVSGSDDRGVFRETEGSDAYLFSQFENVDARRAIPCFDEPSFKIPWQLTLRVKPSDKAFSNTPVVEEKVDADGFRTVKFAPTKPMPSYLVAFAVGPFDVVDAGKSDKSKTPVRIVVPRGKSAEAGFAASAAPKILDRLETAFGIPYPFEKLDYVIVPNLVSFGAMENVGMITIAEYAALARKGEDTVRQRQESVLFMAHESAHQWFGDLVTMAWWDDVWLNEGFATWMERKISMEMEPTFETELFVVEETSRTMNQDGLLSARKVRQEVGSYDDISNAFDAITYQKGGAVLGMFEGFIGPDAFLKGVRGYLDKFAWKNATSNDFLAAMSAGSGVDVRAAFSSFLDQPGVPLVSATLSCDASGAKLSLAQERALPLGSKGSATAQTWQIPVCARYGEGKASGRACTLLTGKTGELPLPKLAGAKSACPAWVMPKESGHGYYRAAYTPKQVTALLDKKTPLTAAERLSLVLDLRALVATGKFPVGDALMLVSDLLKDKDPRTGGAAAGMVGWLTQDQIPDDLRPNVKRFVNKVVAPRARALGWQAKAGDSTGTRQLRQQLLGTMVELGDDPKLFAEADALALKWLDDPNAIEADSVDLVLTAAASRGDRKLFDRMLALFRKEQDSRRRERVIGALAAFRDPALLKEAMSLYLDPKLDPRSTIGVLWAPQYNARASWDFVKANFDAILARTPVETRPYLVMPAGQLCDEKSRADLESFMAERSAKIMGAPRLVAQQVEGISLCIARREAHAESLKAFLMKQ